MEPNLSCAAARKAKPPPNPRRKHVCEGLLGAISSGSVVVYGYPHLLIAGSPKGEGRMPGGKVRQHVSRELGVRI
jgi:hypothetical protein